jgi:hypothetical protein
MALGGEGDGAMKCTLMIVALIAAWPAAVRADGAAACMKWSHEAYEASKVNPSFNTCIKLYPREIIEQTNRDINDTKEQCVLAQCRSFKEDANNLNLDHCDDLYPVEMANELSKEASEEPFNSKNITCTNNGMISLLQPGDKATSNSVEAINARQRLHEKAVAPLPVPSAKISVQKGDNFTWIQNKGEPVQILDVEANRGNCLGSMMGWDYRSTRGVIPFNLNFGGVQSISWNAPDGSACNIIELRVHMQNNDLTFAWK